VYSFLIKRIKNEAYIILILFGLFLGQQIIFGTSYLSYIIMFIIPYYLFTASWDILYSYSGQLSLGQAIPFGTGAFAMGILSRFINPIIALLGGCIVGGIIGGVIGASTLRLRPAYQGIALLVFSQILYWQTLYEFGDEGISFGLSSGRLIISTSKIYFIGIIIFLLVSLGIALFTKTNLALRLKAIKNDAVAAEAIGINTVYYKIVIFFLSSFIAALGGAFFALYNYHVDYSIFAVSNSFLPIGMAVVGGTGSFIGPLLGSFLISLLLTYLPVYYNLAITYIVYAIIVIGVLRFYPKGLAHLIIKYISKRGE